MRVLCIGHSYAVPINRSIENWIASNSEIRVGVVGPNQWPGDLRNLQFEHLGQGSKLNEYHVTTHFSKWVHLFHYDKNQIRKILQEGWDGVHIWEEPYLRASCLLGREIRAAGLPYTFLTDQNIAKRFPWPFNSWEREFVQGSRGWAGCGKQVLEVQRERDYPEENVALLPHCVDTTRFKKPTEGEKNAIREKWGLNGPVIGYVGRFVEEKGIPLILEVLGKIDSKLWGGLVFLGSGPLESSIRKWVKTHGLRDRVRIQLVKHGEMPNVLPGIDILFSASQTRKNWKEQLGRMLIEAMACGIPNVASDSGEIPYTVGSGGIIFPEKSAEAGYSALDKLLKDAKLRNEIGDKALLESRRFSVSRVGQAMRKFWLQAFSG
jgi:glycosyltransferase involved in cell wall biosynthesis